MRRHLPRENYLLREAEYLTMMFVVRDMGLEPEELLDMRLGKKMQQEYTKHTGRRPRTELVEKTWASGSHDIAVYTVDRRVEAEKLVRKDGAARKSAAPDLLSIGRTLRFLTEYATIADEIRAMRREWSVKLEEEADELMAWRYEGRTHVKPLLMVVGGVERRIYPADNSLEMRECINITFLKQHFGSSGFEPPADFQPPLL